MPVYPQELSFNWNDYSVADVGLIHLSAFRICRHLYEQLSPVVDVSQIYKDMKIQIVPEKTAELRKFNALGIAYRNRNTTVIPRNLNPFIMSVYSGLLGMEIAHSKIERLTGSVQYSNDTIHYLYNNNDLIRFPFKKNLTLVIPNIRKAYVERDQIMKIVKEGKAPGRIHAYFTAPGAVPKSKILADAHELEHIKNFLVYGHVNGSDLPPQAKA